MRCDLSLRWVEELKFVELFDKVFVLDVDRATLLRRLEERPVDEFGGRQSEREFILLLHQTREEIPTDGIVIDATVPLAQVVDEILRQSSVDSLSASAERDARPLRPKG